MSYSANEVMQLAMQIEENGARFYNEASQLVQDEGASQLFKYLAREEERHMDIFEKIAANLAVDSTPYEDETAELYLKSLVDSRFFTDLDGVLARVKRGEVVNVIKEVVQYALGVEKETLLFYYSLLDSAAANKSLFEEIIAEEKNHVVKLNEILSLLGNN